jgi:tetratricopeptide (TPR) repeat protein
LVTSVVAAFCVLIAGMASAIALREEQIKCLEAKETLSRFHFDAETAHFLLVCTSNDRLEEGRRTCRSTLDHFQVLENPDWRQTPTVQRLPEQDRLLLRDEIGELLVLLAHAQQLAGDRENNPNLQKEFFLEGLQLCSLATDTFGDDHIPLALLNQQGELHKRLKDQDKAHQYFERVRQSKVRTVQDRYLSARLLAEKGEYRKALPLLDEAIRLKPQDFNLHFLQGVCHDYNRQHDKAIACFRTCIALRPKFHGAYYNRGLSYARQGNPQSAVDDFDQVVRMNPDFVETYAQRAMALLELKKYAEAIGDLTEAIDRGDTQTRLYFLRATARAKAGDPEGAKKDLDEGLRRKPTDEHSWIARGIAYLESIKPAEPKRALSDFEEARKLNPRSLPALQNKAHVLGKYFKRTEEAAETLTIAVELYPDDVRPLAGRGLYQARLGNRAAAIKDAELAVQLDTDPANLYMVACIYALTSKQEPDDRIEALQFLSAALKRGYGFQHVENDEDLDPIRRLPMFDKVVQAARAMRDAAALKRR